MKAVRTTQQLHAIRQHKHETFVEWMQRVNTFLYENEGSHVVMIEPEGDPDIRRTAYLEFSKTEMRYSW